MSIKQRIFLSNILMFAFLLIYTIGLLYFALNSFSTAYNSFINDEGGFNSGTGISLSAFENITDSFVDRVVALKGEIQNSEDSAVRQVLNSDIQVIADYNGQNVYRTENIKYDRIIENCEEYMGTNLSGNMIFFGERGFVYSTDFVAGDGNPVRVILFSDTITVRKSVGDKSMYITNLITNLKESVQSFAFLGAVIIIIINLVLVTVITNSIMKPLNQLKEGAQKILRGDLDFTINYERDDEITEVLDSFDRMRRQLSDSGKEQKRYEENRKRLIAGISHDLRTPLTSIKGYVSGLLDGIADTPEKQERYLKTIYNTADDMDRLVDDLFLFSKLDMDKMPFTFEELNISEFMSMCCEEIRFNLEKNRVVLTYTDLCGGPVYINIDRNKFARVLLNIADNTVKYKKNEIGNLHVVLEKKDGYVDITMKDDGIGVAPDKINKIFETFYRTDEARTNPVKGSGLGLSIAKQIVEAHGGHIKAESNTGEGLSIIISLPYDNNKQIWENPAETEEKKK